MRGERPEGGFEGVRVTARPRRRPRGAAWVLAGIVVLALGAAGWMLSRRVELRGGRTAGADAAAAQHTAEPRDIRQDARPRPAAASPGAIVATNAPRDGEDPTLDLADYVLPGEAPAMGDVIAALHARGIRTGLGAFPPPGTSPPLRGLEVPDGFVLPDGYVRHYQATDDGERIAPILMFAPDREFIVIRGRRVPIPAERVVTPDLAPPGLPSRWVRIPPVEPGGRR